LIIALAGCSNDREATNSEVLGNFIAALEILTPDTTVADAQATAVLSRLRPDDASEWDGNIGNVTLYAQFSDDGSLAIGRIGIEGHSIGEEIAKLLEKRYGTPEIIHDTWTAPEAIDATNPPQRTEIKWAYPGGLDLVWHSEYPGDETRDFMPPHTVVRM